MPQEEKKKNKQSVWVCAFLLFFLLKLLSMNGRWLCSYGLKLIKLAKSHMLKRISLHIAVQRFVSWKTSVSKASQKTPWTHSHCYIAGAAFEWTETHTNTSAATKPPAELLRWEKKHETRIVGSDSREKRANNSGKAKIQINLYMYR